MQFAAFGGEVDDLGRRGGEAVGGGEVVFAEADVQQGLEGGDGGAEQHAGAVDARQGDGGVAAVVARRGVGLLVGRVLFFVDDDQPEVVVREEQGGAGAQDDGRGAGAERLGGAAAADRRPAGMEDQQLLAEFRREKRLQPVAKSDFRGEDQGLAPGGEGLPQGGKVFIPTLVPKL